MKIFRVGLFLVASLAFFQCEDDQPPNCTDGKLVLTVTEETGTLHYNQQRASYYIRYFIPGTIDTNYIGFVCTNAFPEFAFTEGMSVTFSGNFRETSVYDNNDFEIVVGGQEIYLLQLEMLAAG